MTLFNKDDKKSILSGQKPKKRSAFPRWLAVSSLSLLCFCIYSLGSNLKLNFRGTKEAIKASFSNKHEGKLWLFKYIYDDKSDRIEEKEKQRIEKYSFHFLTKGTQDELEHLANKILNDSSFSKIHIFKSDDSTLNIKLSKHKPIFTIKAKNLHYVSDKGVVYGSADDESLPKLYGFLSRSSKQVLQNNEILLSNSQKNKIKGALTLYNEAKSKNLLIESIEYKKFRGYFLTLAESKTVISFGKAPFGGKINKLSKILKKLTSKGQIASSIELDFEDKAFIKERIF